MHFGNFSLSDISRVGPSLNELFDLSAAILWVTWSGRLLIISILACRTFWFWAWRPTIPKSTVARFSWKMVGWGWGEGAFPALCRAPEKMMKNEAFSKTSATGTRTRVARVRAEYPNQPDYSGTCKQRAASKTDHFGPPTVPPNPCFLIWGCFGGALRFRWVCFKNFGGDQNKKMREPLLLTHQKTRPPWQV